METMSWRESFSCLFLNCFLFNLASVETQMRTGVNTFYEESPKWPTTDGLTGFGGVLKKGVIDMLSNNTDVREIVKFAVRHASSSNPVMFPASAASKYVMHVRNISQLVTEMRAKLTAARIERESEITCDSFIVIYSC